MPKPIKPGKPSKTQPVTTTPTTPPAPTTPPTPTQPTAPVLPLIHVNTTYTQPTGKTIHVADGQDLQAALNAAYAGDTITLQIGSTYTGSYILPNKTGDAYIVVTTQGFSRQGRVTPDVPMACIVGPNMMPAISTATSAHHFRFVGIEIRSGTRQYNNGLVRFGTGSETSVSQFPHHLILDRCYIHGDAEVGGKRGVMLSGDYLAVIDCHLSDWKGVGQDTQAICGWTGRGPWKIQNNFIEGAGENLLVGGSDPLIADLVPSDIEILGNTFSKRLEWNPYLPEYDGSNWSVKNLLEFKNGRRVLVSDNTFENNWSNAQSGRAILFTVKNQDGLAPWTTIEDITFTQNTIRDSLSGICVSGNDGQYASAGGRRFLIAHNLLIRIGGAKWGEGQAPDWVSSSMFALTGGVDDLTIDHNTLLHGPFDAEGSLITADGAAYNRFVFTNNIAQHNAYGIKGSGTGVGNPTLAVYFPNAVVRRNVLVGADSTLYPVDNYFPPDVGSVGFVSTQDPRLLSTSPYHNMATDGSDIGY